MGGDRLFYYSSSADRAPGEGVHEHVSDPAPYRELAARPGWRRMLSNFWVADFTLEGRTWRTVEHRFQAAKIALADQAAASLFTLESGSELAQGDGNAARKMRKMVVLTAAQLAAWERMKRDVMQAAMRAKFTQHPDLGALLLATGDAELWHSAGRGHAPGRVHELEAVRAELRAARTDGPQAPRPG